MEGGFYRWDWETLHLTLCICNRNLFHNACLFSHIRKACVCRRVQSLGCSPLGDSGRRMLLGIGLQDDVPAGGFFPLIAVSENRGECRWAQLAFAVGGWLVSANICSGLGVLLVGMCPTSDNNPLFVLRS